MKRFIILLLCLFPMLLSVSLCAQDKPQKKTKKIKTVQAEKNVDVYKVVAEMPEFPGGKDAMFQYIFDNIRFSDADREKGIDGLVVVNFIVDEEGEISNIKVLKSVSPSLDKEAQRVINKMPKWKPGKHQGKIVKVEMNVPVKFKL